MNDLIRFIDKYLDSDERPNEVEFKDFSAEFLNGLNTGKIRAAQPEGDEWKINVWVKRGILLLFKFGKLVDMSEGNKFRFYDKHTIPTKQISLRDKVRIVPGGSLIRIGTYTAPGVICMPPMFINIGAFVDEGSMIDSHALVGTCGQIGKRVHLSAASQIGGVLEPAGARPTIVEDDVMIGGNCGIYEGVLVGRGAVLGSGTVLNASTKVYDLVREEVLASVEGETLKIPAGAVVIPGSRKLKGEFAERFGLSAAAPIIVKYRDEKTDARTALEDALR